MPYAVRAGASVPPPAPSALRGPRRRDGGALRDARGAAAARRRAPVARDGRPHKSKVCQILSTARCEMPSSLARRRLLQREAFGGCSCRVLASTASTRSSLMERGAPLRGSSRRPARRRATKRARHLPTVCVVTPRRRAASRLERALREASTMRARSASAPRVRGLRAHRRSCPCSSSVSVIVVSLSTEVALTSSDDEGDAARSVITLRPA